MIQRRLTAYVFVSGVFFVACDNQVVSTTGSGGATSATSNVATNATVVGSTSTQAAVTTGAGTTSGAGGASSCPDACTKAEGCGLPAGQCAMYLDCGTALGQCLAVCLNDPTIGCQDLFDAFQTQSGPFFDCAQMCQGGMTTTAASTGTGMMMGTCQTCGQQQCTQAAVQCFQTSGQMECQGWIQCANACTDAACLDACTTMFPGGGVMETCLCTSCINDCGAVCN